MECLGTVASCHVLFPLFKVDCSCSSVPSFTLNVVNPYLFFLPLARDLLVSLIFFKESGFRVMGIFCGFLFSVSSIHYLCYSFLLLALASVCAYFSGFLKKLKQLFGAYFPPNILTNAISSLHITNISHIPQPVCCSEPFIGKIRSTPFNLTEFFPHYP